MLAIELDKHGDNFIECTILNCKTDSESKVLSFRADYAGLQVAVISKHDNRNRALPLMNVNSLIALAAAAVVYIGKIALELDVDVMPNIWERLETTIIDWDTEQYPI